MRQYYFDTSSLVALSRYYLPFDESHQLEDFIRRKFLNNELVVLDTILNEIKYISQGSVLKTLTFITERKDLIVNTSELLPVSPRRFDNLVSNNFVIQAFLKNGVDIDFSVMKRNFLDSGDGKLILTMYNMRENGANQSCIVTEESRFSNDRKGFKKIPAICDIIHAECVSLVDYLKLTPLHISF